MALQTEFDFYLPKGYIDGAGVVHRAGCLRLATAQDEIEAVHDSRVQANEAFLPVVLLSRVILRLGDLEAVTPAVIEGLFVSDLAYLEDLYMRFNSQEEVILNAVCPHCSGHFKLQVAPLGNNVE